MAGQHVQANLINEKGDNSKKTDLKSEDEILDKIAQTPTEIKLKDGKDKVENSDKKPDQATQHEQSGNAHNIRNGSNTNGEKPVQSYLALTSLGMGKKDATKHKLVSKRMSSFPAFLQFSKVSIPEGETLNSPQEKML